MIYCCGGYFEPLKTVFLIPDFRFRDRKLEVLVCPKCGSKNLTKIDRMNGYLSYSRVKGDTRLNAAKMAEISERKSM